MKRGYKSNKFFSKDGKMKFDPDSDLSANYDEKKQSKHSKSKGKAGMSS
jgi:hypothetical protein